MLGRLAAELRWSASALADSCNVSVRTLRRHIQRKTGKSTKAWLGDQRQRCAAQLLASGSSVKEIALILGYTQPANFSRGYKRYWGNPPTTATNMAQLSK